MIHVRSFPRLVVVLLGLLLAACTPRVTEPADARYAPSGTAATSGGTAVAAAFATGASVGLAEPELPAPVVVFEEESSYNRVFVVDEGDERYLRFGAPDSDDQSLILKSDPGAVPMEYVRYAFIGVTYMPRMERMLMIGLGGGTFSTLLHRLYPELSIDAVDIDPVVVKAATGYFGVTPDERYRIHVADGATFIREAKERYDLVFLDAYSGPGIPKHLRTKKFFESARDVLAPGGIVALNNAAFDAREQKAITNNFLATFPRTECFETLDGSNTILIGATEATEMPVGPKLVALARSISAEKELPYDLTAIARRKGTGCP